MKIKISENLVKALNHAKAAALKYAHPEIGSEHILYGFLCVEGSLTQRILKELGVKKEGFAPIFASGLHAAIMGEPDFTLRVKTALNEGYEQSLINGEVEAKSEYVLLCLLSDPTAYACVILQELFKVNLKELFATVIYNIRLRASNAEAKGSNGGFNNGGFSNNGFSEPRKSVADETLPAELGELGIDLTLKARENKIDPVIGRNEEIERIIQILCRKTKNNPVLIGEPGVGKSAIVEGLAKRIVSGSVPEILKDKIVFSLDIASLIAGTKYRGAMEEKLKNAISLIRSQQNIIVFIDELHTLAQSGHKEGEVSPADILKPYLARGELQTIGATTTDEYRKFIEKDKALERRFQPIIVAPPNVEDTIEILKGLKANYEAFHKVELTTEAIEAAAKLSDRYIADRFLPDKAIDLIDEAMSRAKVSGNTVPRRVKEIEDEINLIDKQKSDAVLRDDYDKAKALRAKQQELIKEYENYKLNWSKKSESGAKITADDIAEIVSKWTKIPVKKLSETEAQRLMQLEEILHERVIGQAQAVESVAKAIRRAGAGLKDVNRPIGTFLFLGPTGVGKTELTKALSEAMFDDENAVIRLDMSEYMESHSVSKLIGSPPGYIGFDEGGQLTEQVRRRPYCVVLLDEIEKAHPDVYNILLQLLDDGRLTDSQGRTVSFKNTVIIMTSNVGVSELKEKKSFSLGFATKAEDERAKQTGMEEVLTAALKRHFKPEFINRIDVVSIFHYLSRADIKKIMSLMLNRVKKSLKEKRIELTISEEALEFLVQKGYDQEYGARHLRRAIQVYLEDAIAQALLSGEIKDGNNAHADLINGAIKIRKV